MIPTNVAQRYKAVQVQTCSPGGLLVLLLQGLVRFLGEAAVAMRANDRARAGERLDRSHAILTELSAGLKRDQAPELCDNLQGVYVFCMEEIVRSNIEQNADRIDGIVRVLIPIRDGFAQAVRAVEANAA
jgi:flagellar protein FliS